MKYLKLILFLQLTWFNFYSQTFIPVLTTGYDIDAVAETAPNALATTTKELDDVFASNKVMYTLGFASTLGFTGGLPNSGTIINGTKTYQLRPYNSNNCLFAQTATTKTLTVSTPAQFSMLSFLVFSTEGSSTMNVKVNYTDLSSTFMGSFIIADWFGGPSPAFCCMGRCPRVASVSSFDGMPSNPNLYSFDVNLSCVDQLKNVKSIEFNTTVGTLAAYVMAVSGVSVSTVLNTLNYPSNILCSNSSSVSPIITGASGGTFIATPAGLNLNTSSGIINPLGSALNNYTVSYISPGPCSSISIFTLSVVASPTISVNSGTICNGSSFTLMPSGAVSYTFSGGSSIVSPSVSTNYIVTGTNALGCVGLNTSTLTVQPTPTLTVNSGTICSGSSFTIIPNGAFSYTYSGGSNIVSPIVTTNYTVFGSSSGGCIGIGVVNAVVVNSSPTLTINSGTICNGSSFTLTPGGAVSYTFSGGSSIVSPIATTNYTVFGTGSSGCLSFITNTVFVVITPILVPSASPSNICKNEQAILSALGASNYTWMPGSFVSNSISVFPLSTTLYTVFGTNSSGGLTCNSSNTILVNVKPLSNISAFSNTSICVGDFAQISATGGDTYTWQPIIGVLNPTLSTTNVKPIITTIYTVTAIASGSCSNTSTVQITVNPLPYVYAGVDTTINIDETYVLNGIGDVTVGFLPLDGNPLNCNFCSSVEVNPKENTCYTLKGMTNFGCENSDDICITVTKDYNIYIPNAFTPNGDIDNEFFIPVGYGLSEIKLFIFDRWGVEIFRSSDENLGWDGKVKGKACLQGVYVYQVKITTLGGKKIIRTGHVTLLSKVQ